MLLYKVYYEGFYLIEAETDEEAYATSHEDYDVEYDEHRNTRVEEAE